MDSIELNTALAQLPLGGVRFFSSIGSTNDEAMSWAAKGAEDLSVVVADEQTAGRGRMDRPWFTPPSSALAFSLILRPKREELPHLSRIVGLAALAITDALSLRGLAPQIKWPNDILLNGRKVAGILIEISWAGEEVRYVVIGVGVNTARTSAPTTDVLRFPAISMEHILNQAPDRTPLLRDILAGIISLRPHMPTDAFLNAWSKSLAWYGKDVRVEMGGDQVVNGRITGLESDGSLKLVDERGKPVTVRFGDVRLRLFA